MTNIGIDQAIKNWSKSADDWIASNNSGVGRSFAYEEILNNYLIYLNFYKKYKCSKKNNVSVLCLKCFLLS